MAGRDSTQVARMPLWHPDWPSDGGAAPLNLRATADGMLVVTPPACVGSGPPMVLLVKETTPDGSRDDMCVTALHVRRRCSHAMRPTPTVVHVCVGVCVGGWWMHVVFGSSKAAMLSCGHRNLWRAMVETRKKAKRKHAGDSDQHWSYDDFVMPLLCVCGTHVFIGAGIVTADKGEWWLAVAAARRLHVSLLLLGPTRHQRQCTTNAHGSCWCYGHVRNRADPCVARV